MGTVYSPCARLTIQKLLVPRESVPPAGLVWLDGEGWVEAEGYERLIDLPLYTGAVHEAGDGPGYYNAEINVKGRVIYGYTWNVRRMNDGDGDYRITYSFDSECGGVSLNTFFTEGLTEIMVPLEEEESAKATEDEGGGATAVLDCADNLTYIDVRIHARNSSGGNSPHEGGGGGAGGGGGGRGPGGAR